MTTEAAKQLESRSENETTAGNYFISNYPPYSFWTPEQVSEFHAALQSEPDPRVPLGIYLHIPFCRRRCHFCYYKVYIDKNAAEIRRYVDTALQELSIYANTPFVAGRKPKFVYFGGGTPSYLSSDQLTTLADQMKSRLPWDEAEEVTFECEPGTLTEKKLRVIRDIGITRLSLGIEHFDDHILEINGRAHHSKEIFRAYDFARSISFPQINIDLIAGMVEEMPEKWCDCVRQAVALEADSITIYQMEIPYNTVIYRQMKARGDLVAPVAGWRTKREWVKYAFAEFEKAGYTVASGYTAVKDPSRTHFVYRDQLWKGADLIGLGVSSFGHVGGTHYQNEHDFHPYLAKLEEGALPVHRALKLTDEERLIRELILQMKLGGISRKYFQAKFEVDICERFAEPIGALQEAGFLQRSGDDVMLSREGLLRVDRLLPGFFLPKHQNARYT